MGVKTGKMFVCFLQKGSVSYCSLFSSGKVKSLLFVFQSRWNDLREMQLIPCCDGRICASWGSVHLVSYFTAVF